MESSWYRHFVNLGLGIHVCRCRHAYFYLEIWFIRKEQGQSVIYITDMHQVMCDSAIKWDFLFQQYQRSRTVIQDGSTYLGLLWKRISPSYNRRRVLTKSCRRLTEKQMYIRKKTDQNEPNTKVQERNTIKEEPNRSTGPEVIKLFHAQLN